MRHIGGRSTVWCVRVAERPARDVPHAQGICSTDVRHISQQQAPRRGCSWNLLTHGRQTPYFHILARLSRGRVTAGACTGLGVSEPPAAATSLLRGVPQQVSAHKLGSDRRHDLPRVGTVRWVAHMGVGGIA